MNVLEDMIRTTAQATADEVSPASLPSLRLPVRRHRGRASRAHMLGNRWVTAMAAAAAVVAVAVTSAVVSAGSGHAPATHGGHHAPAAHSTDGRPSARQIAVDNNQVIGLFMAATGAQRAPTSPTPTWLRWPVTAASPPIVDFPRLLAVPSVSRRTKQRARPGAAGLSRRSGTPDTQGTSFVAARW